MRRIREAHTGIPFPLLVETVVVDQVTVRKRRQRAFKVRLLLQGNRHRLAVRPPCQLEDSDVIDFHRLREHGLRRWIAVKIAADRQVHQQMELLIERCRISVVRRLSIAQAVPVIFGRIQYAVYIPADFPRLPFNRVGVELFNRGAARQHIFLAGIYIVRPLGTVMNCACNRARTAAPALHNINFPGCGP
ncbi:hypothetical protein D3C75_908660 [compost metagenome]